MFKNQKGVISTLIVAGALIFLTASTIITSLLIKNRLSLNPKAAVNTDPCIQYIVPGSVQFLDSGGAVIPTGTPINSISGLKCKLRVTAPVGSNIRADKFNVCGIKINGIWPNACPHDVDTLSTANPDWDYIDHAWAYDGSTIFNHCDQILQNLVPGDSLQPVVARFTTGDERQCKWNISSQYVAGPVFRYQRDTPITPQTALYMNPNSVAPGAQITVTATGTTFCSGNISDYSSTPPTGLTSCNQSGGFSCSSINPTGDGKPCWWRWTCNASNNADNYTATFTGNNSNPSCTSTAPFTVQTAPPPIQTPVPTTPTPTDVPDGNSRVFINPPGPNGDIIMTVFAVPKCSTNIVTKIDGNPNTCQSIPGSPGNLGYTCGTWDWGNPLNPLNPSYPKAKKASYGNLDISIYPCWFQFKCNSVANDSNDHTAQFSTTDWLNCAKSTTFRVNPSKQDIKQPTCTGAIVKKNGTEVTSVVRKGDTITVQAQNVANATRVRFAMTRKDTPTCRSWRNAMGPVLPDFYDIGIGPQKPSPSPSPVPGLVDDINYSATPQNVNSYSFKIPTAATMRTGDYYVFANPAAIYSYRVRGSNNPPYSWVYTSNPAADYKSDDPYTDQFWCTNNGANDGSKCNGNYCDDVAMADKVNLISRNNVDQQPDCVTELTITN